MASTNWAGEKPQCSSVRQYPALDLLLSPDLLHWIDSHCDIRKQERDAAQQASPADAANIVEQELSPEPPAQQVANSLPVDASQTAVSSPEDQAEQPSSQLAAIHLPVDAAQRAAGRPENQVEQCAGLLHERQQPLEPLVLEDQQQEQHPTAGLAPHSQQLLEPLVLDDEFQNQKLPEGLAPERQDSDWSFLSQSLRTESSKELNESLDPSDDDRQLPDVPIWRRMSYYIWGE